MSDHDFRHDGDVLRARDQLGRAELMILTRGADGQRRIQVIHWSSHMRRTAGAK